MTRKEFQSYRLRHIWHGPWGEYQYLYTKAKIQARSGKFWDNIVFHGYQYTKSTIYRLADIEMR